MQGSLHHMIMFTFSMEIILHVCSILRLQKQYKKKSIRCVKWQVSQLSSLQQVTAQSLIKSVTMKVNLTLHQCLLAE